MSAGLQDESEVQKRIMSQRHTYDQREKSNRRKTMSVMHRGKDGEEGESQEQELSSVLNAAQESDHKGTEEHPVGWEALSSSIVLKGKT